MQNEKQCKQLVVVLFTFFKRYISMGKQEQVKQICLFLELVVVHPSKKQKFDWHISRDEN